LTPGLIKATQKIIYTIGHSTRTLEEFIALLQTFSIEMLVDVRSYPGSRRYPHFNKENLSKELPGKGILYLHMSRLGGRRKASPQSKNTAWKNDAFRGYADYMETAEFKEGMEELETTGSSYPSAFMCSEAVWWRCHRSMIADYMKVKGWKVLHILNNKKAEEHPYTAAATIADGTLSYAAKQQSIF
jgi:uncharacterized protein (DUF488 family)